MKILAPKIQPFELILYLDDLLPVKDNRLLFCKNIEEPNEFWAALLEKVISILLNKIKLKLN